jgi:hypothetical protein
MASKLIFDPQFDPVRRRLHIRYTGFWTIVDALAVAESFRKVLNETGAARRDFTLLDDLRDWPVQSQEVLEVTKTFPDLVRNAPITRNAMIIPQALLRLQVGRTLYDLPNCSVFETLEEADRWLAEVEPSSR